jgi:hypothetical protein
MIHKNSTVFKKTGWRQYEMVNPINLKDGDTVRGFNPKTLKYEEIKIMSILKVSAQRVLLRMSSLENIVISTESYLASSNRFWCYKDLTNRKAFKVLKKDPTIFGANTFTPYILTVTAEHNDIFYDIRTDSECPVLVDNFLQYFKSTESGKYGFETEINGSECITQSLDAEQRTIRVPEESES